MSPAASVRPLQRQNWVISCLRRLESLIRFLRLLPKSLLSLPFHAFPSTLDYETWGIVTLFFSFISCPFHSLYQFPPVWLGHIRAKFQEIGYDSKEFHYFYYFNVFFLVTPTMFSRSGNSYQEDPMVFDYLSEYVISDRYLRLATHTFILKILSFTSSR